MGLDPIRPFTVQNENEVSFCPPPKRLAALPQVLDVLRFPADSAS